MNPRTLVMGNLGKDPSTIMMEKVGMDLRDTRRPYGSLGDPRVTQETLGEPRRP
jgi:hypothetical protein